MECIQCVHEYDLGREDVRDIGGAERGACRFVVESGGIRLMLRE